MHKRVQLVALLLFLVGLGVGAFFAHLGDFVHEWDERFHFLVAQNMVEHDFSTFQLYSPPELAPNVCRDWTCQGNWLHKPPMTIWQIALGFKVFGVTPFYGRLFSVLLFAVLVSSTYVIIGRLTNSRLALILSVLLLGNFTLHWLISGRQGMDHVDLAFTVYVSLGVLFGMLYIQTTKMKHLLLVSLFVALAIMTKWIVGLIPFLFLGIHYLINIKREGFKGFGRLATASALAIALAFPWYFYAAMTYPEAFTYFIEYSARHYTEALEGHSGGWAFYMQVLRYQYAIYMIPFIVLGFAFGIAQRHRDTWLALLFTVLFVLAFFTSAATKLIMYTIPLMLPMLFSAALTFDLIFTWIAKRFNLQRNILLTVFLVLYLVRQANIPMVMLYDSPGAKDYLIENRAAIESFAAKQSGKTAIYNMPSCTYIDLMFYTDLLGYNKPLDEELRHQLLKRNYKLLNYNDLKKNGKLNLHGI